MNNFKITYEKKALLGFIILMVWVLTSARVLRNKTKDSCFFKDSEIVYYSSQDSLKVIDLLKEVPQNFVSSNEYVIYFAHKLLNTPYVEKTLEKDPEGLVVNFSGLDCTTFMENCLALARTAERKGLWSDYLEELRMIRYRNGRIKGYISRLHYFVDWKINNGEKGIVEDLTEALGGKNYAIYVDFMSTHSDAYPMMKGKKELIRKIERIEDFLNKQEDYFVLEVDRIEAVSGQIQSGDLIAFITTIKGLDASHVAVAYQADGRLTFIHASSRAKKTIIEPGTLSEYVRRQGHVGIMLLRPMNRD